MTLIDVEVDAMGAVARFKGLENVQVKSKLDEDRPDLLCWTWKATVSVKIEGLPLFVAARWEITAPFPVVLGQQI